MEKLYQKQLGSDRYGFIVETGPEREVPLIEGIVQRASAQNYKERGTARHFMQLKIDTFEGNLSMKNADYRIDKGERIRVYSTDGFDLHDGDTVVGVQGIQILNEQGEVKFQSTYATDVEFK